MKRDLAGGFSLPMPPKRTPVDETKAAAFVEAERPSGIVEVASAKGDGSPAVARLSVDIPAATLRTLKIRAIERGVTLRELVLELIAGA